MMSLFRSATVGVRFCQGPAVRAMSHYFMKMNELPDDEVRTNYTAIFEKGDIDGWQVRKAMCDMNGLDMVPSPAIINSALKACRRCNDYALAVRFLEAVRFKCGGKLNTIWPYLLQEIQPTLDELGIDTPEQLGYDKPELAIKSVFDDDYRTTE